MSVLECMACRASYPVRDNIACFAPDDPFYETRYRPGPFTFFPRNAFQKILLYLLADHYFYYLDRHIPQNALILDVACGAGSTFLGRKGEAAGLDVSFDSLTRLDSSYARAVQGSALHVPFPDGAFECIVAKSFFEHVPVEQKPALLTEFYRLLKPGGRLIMQFDCDCTNRLWLWAKKDPELFRSEFIENDGHYGLILPSESLALLEQSGFRTTKYAAPGKTSLVNLPMLMWLQAYRGKSRILDVFLMLGRVVSRRRSLIFAYNTAVTLWDDVVGPWLPLDKARYLIVVCEKTDRPESERPH